MKCLWTAALGTLLSMTGVCAAQAQATNSAARLQEFRVQRDAMKHGGLSRLSGGLVRLQEAQAGAAKQRSLSVVRAGRNPLMKVVDGLIVVDAIAKPGQAQALRTELVGLGLQNATAFGNVVSGRLPVSALADLAAASSLQFARPAVRAHDAGLVTSQGDRSLNTDVARARFEVDGTGIRVGALSDSFNCTTGPLLPGQMHTTAAQDVANGDLPAGVVILKEDPTCEDGIDEGRAMLQIIHDVAPGARLAFHTADDGEADFANGIVQLAVQAGADVIVDDISYLTEPMFQDGNIAQAVDYVRSKGIAYYSSAGNRARQSYVARFRRSGLFGASGEQHDFDPGRGVDTLQTITLTTAAIEVLSFQWDQPFASVSGAPGATSDLDIIFYDLDGDLIPFCDDNLEPAVCQLPGIDVNPGADPVELAVISNQSGADVQVAVSLELFSGPPPALTKYVYFDFGDGAMTVDDFDTQSPTTFGHSNAAGSEAVGAAPWYNTAEWGPAFHAECVPACLEIFSSAGGTPILFDINGKRLKKPVVRIKPGVVGPDGGNTSFFFAPYPFEVPGSTEPDEFPNFFGTSASAPHVAAVAALMLDQRNDGIAAGSNWKVCVSAKHHKEQTLILPPAAAAQRIASGARFRDCDAITPQEINDVLRDTAEDMRFAAGRLTEPFVVGRKGFDADTGYGFVNAVKAISKVKKH
jgi:subtilisin family serine protease